MKVWDIDAHDQSFTGAPSAPVVFLHGQPGAASDWDAVIRLLPESVRCMALDRPGYRASPYSAGTLAENASWLVGELDRAGIGDAILVGHSYGGGVALTTAALFPERVRGLVLVSSVGPDCLDGWDRLLAAPVAGTICALTAWRLTPWFARKRLARLIRLQGRPLEPDEHLNLDAWGNARHEHGAMWRTFLLEQREIVRNLDRLVANLDRVLAPCVIVADPGDTLIPIATAQALHARLTGSKLVLANHGGHNLARRNPQAIAAEIQQFIFMGGVPTDSV